MLFPQLLIQELNNRREDFVRFAESQIDELESYLALLNELAARPSEQVRATLGGKEIGAIPSDEIDEHHSLTIKFEPRWQNHEEARRWASQILKNRTTFAADGSQIQPGREVSMQVAAIQIGSFENRHNESGEYKKQARLRLVAPNDFYESDLLDEKPVNTDTIVGYLRFSEEIEEIKRFLREKANWQSRGERAPLAFVDNTLLLSIAMPQTRLQNLYISTMVELVRLSEKTGVPLVGFVDQSYARDVVSLLDNFNVLTQNFLHQPSDSLSDAQLFNHETLPSWGDRTAFFYCERKGLSEFFRGENGDSIVGCVYLRTTGEGIPARIDVPAWIYESGLLEETIDTIRAECVVGTGYPYALETADATAVISTRDREMFLRAVQDFARRENLNFRVANKRMSKARRR